MNETAHEVDLKLGSAVFFMVFTPTLSMFPKKICTFVVYI